MDIWSSLLSVLSFIWMMIEGWVYIFISPFKQFDVFWILIPIWLSWFFAEFFQEKKGTSFGNAISNGVVPLFVGFDWIRYIVTSTAAAKVKIAFWILFAKYAISIIVITYGLLIIYYGVRGKEITLYFGRIREVTYVLLVFTPIIYGILGFHWQFFVQIIIFFPVFYYVIEWLDRIVPDPEAFKKDEEKSNKSINSPRDIFDSSGANYNQQNQNFNQSPAQMRSNENTSFGNSMNDNMFK